MGILEKSRTSEWKSFWPWDDFSKLALRRASGGFLLNEAPADDLRFPMMFPACVGPRIGLLEQL
jgi:hypothetical protein